MTDVSYEQLKDLFASLSDKLDKTQGDKLSHDELEAIRRLLSQQVKAMNKASKAGSSTTNQQFISQFFAAWKNQQSQSGGGGGGSTRGRGARNATGPANGPATGTYIQRKRAGAAGANPNATAQAKATNNLANKVMDFGKKVDRLGVSLGGLTSSLQKGAMGGLAGGSVGQILGALDDRTNAYRTMIQTGEGQFTSVQQMTNAVNDAHMTVQELAQAMEKSQGARMVGGASYAQLTGALTKATNGISNMGLSFDQRQEAIQDYLELQKNQGNIRALSQDQMVSGIQSMVKSSGETAHILGITRKEALDARKEQSQDALLQTIIRGMNLNPNQQAGLEDSLVAIKNVKGQAGSDLLRSLVAGVAPTGEAKNMAVTDPAFFQLANNMAEAVKSGGVLDQRSVAAQLKTMAEGRDRSASNTYMAQMALSGQSAMATAIQSNLAGDLKALGLRPEAQADKLGNDGTMALLGAEEALRSSATVLREAFDTLSNSILDTQGGLLRATKDEIIARTEAARVWERSWQQTPELTGKLAMGIGGVVAALGVLKMSAGAIGGLFKMFGGGGARAAAGGAGTYIQRMRAGAAGAAGAGAGAGAAAAGAGALLKRNALIGTAIEGAGYLTGSKEMSWQNLARSGLRIGGGALGGLAGGGIGSVATGLAGYYAGDQLGNYLLGEEKPASPGGGRSPTPISQPTTQRAVQPADATGQRNRGMLSPEQVNQKIMEAQESATAYLKSIKENNDLQSTLMREEIVISRNYGERMVRLLEDGNRISKDIANNAS